MDAENRFHEGHRDRVKESFLKGNPDEWEDYRLLELLLFYAIPQKDVRPLSHLLIETFGSLSAVLSCDEETLCTVPGIGPKTAEFLCSFAKAENALRKEDDSLPTYERAHNLGEMIADYYTAHPDVKTLLLLFDNRMELLRTIPFPARDITSPAVTARAVSEAAYHARASLCVLAYPTPREILIPTGEEIAAATQLYRALVSLGISLEECVMVHRDRFAFLLRQMLGQASETKGGLIYDG